MNEIRDTTYFRPKSGAVKPNWKVFYGETWSEARKMAETAATGASGKSAEYGELHKKSVWSIVGTMGKWNVLNMVGYDVVEGRPMTFMELISNIGKATGSAVFLTALNAGLKAGWYARTGETDKSNWMDDAWYAGLAAARMTAMKTIQLIDPSQVGKKQVEKSEEIWEAYKKGYGCVGEINGTLYVYAARPKQTERS